MDRGAIRRRLVLGLGVLTASGVLGLAVPGTAQAASSTCSGRQVKILSFAAGSVRVYKEDGWVCALTLARFPGPRRSMAVTVQARGNLPVTDQGRFSRVAGPVTVHAGHRCVRITGKVGSASVGSGWILC
ncbi:hypothetical protein [Streptomyces tropicalis]|uniref:Secreted protein n=1 Tax=Streptomyces tropicalis TaxID=3034234 RepID=A0ABT5ZZ00_9ACTN|nr:hypothetical protein [Streptomyces tropicalis]MDF3297615.1 hypothetical protein [Streptomyces tropicalis]